MINTKIKKESEKGAIVVEATIALSVFIFAIFTFLSIVNICYIQAKMGVALDSAAKQISKYSYIYYKFGLDEAEANFADQSEEKRRLMNETLDGVDSFTNVISEAQNGEASLSELASSLESGEQEFTELYNKYKVQMKDPKAFMIGIAKMAASEGINFLKNELCGELLARSFVENNMKAYAGDDVNSFLKRSHVVDGSDGLSFQNTSIMSYGQTDKIQLVVSQKQHIL